MVLETAARNAIDSASLKWPDVERAWIAIEWVLVRDPYVGYPLNEGGTIRAFRYDGARSIGQPDAEVIYEIQPNAIVVHSAEFSDAKASQAGRA